MLRLTTIPPLLGGLLLSGAALALSPTDPQSDEIRAFDTQLARMSAADALGYAELHTAGEPLDVRFELRDGQPGYLVHVMKNDEIITMTIDAWMGVVDTPVSLLQTAAPPLTDERAAAAALRHSNIVFDEAIATGERRLRGSTIGARLALHAGRPIVEVSVVRDRRLYRTTVDPMVDIEIEGR
jgi:uncharacterized membrane protein YkoI